MHLNTLALAEEIGQLIVQFPFQIREKLLADEKNQELVRELRVVGAQLKRVKSENYTVSWILR